MTKDEWRRELEDYKSPRRVAKECIEALLDQIRMQCTHGQTRTVVKTVPRGGARTPFVEEPTVCDRGTSGCHLMHNDKKALEFCLMGFERIVELTGASNG